ncbi:MAG: dethiobiotin synthase [Mobilicoccus sp.]|nr:dethiobiotin synthase [Mobilicoccus sp.]
MSARVLAVTGTNTDVGKTIAAAALIAREQSSEQRVVYVKPAQTGLREGEPGGDADVVARLTRVPTHEFVRLPHPLAPAAAARVVGVRLPGVAEHAERVVELARGDVDVVVLEGAGGLLVQVDSDGGTLADLVRHVQAAGVDVEVVVVADPALGTLNLCALTQEALDSRGLACAGYVFGAWPTTPSLVEEQNALDVPAVTGRRLLGRVPAGAGRLDPATFAAAAPTWFADPGLSELGHPTCGDTREADHE